MISSSKRGLSKGQRGEKKNTKRKTRTDRVTNLFLSEKKVLKTKKNTNKRYKG
jgi:hypothetical protein